MADLTDIDLEQLHFDPENPRLPERLKGASEPEVLKWLLQEGNLIELMLSIGTKGYFSGEPLMVVPRKMGGYLVVEGNRRLGALKLLNGTAPPVLSGQVEQARASAVEKPTKIPAIVFKKRASILTYLGYRHITGVKEWGALAKARYLKQLRDEHAGSSEEAHKALAREIGSKASHVARTLTGYELLRRADDMGILDSIKMGLLKFKWVMPGERHAG